MSDQNPPPKRRRFSTDDQFTGEVKGEDCPYLASINRHRLDFDFEKVCSVCLSNEHVYCCLVCGRFLQGRGKNTHAYIHSLEEHHYLFINLVDRNVYCLPKNYQVTDASLEDIKYNMHPTYTEESVKQASFSVTYGKALYGDDYIPGFLGLNNLKHTDCFNAIVNMLCLVAPLRNYFLLNEFESSKDPIVPALSELMRKIFNPKNFKGIVSPHEFLQTVGVASDKQFRIGQQSDPLAFLAWLLNRLHKSLRNKRDSVIHRCFQGTVKTNTTSVETSDAGVVRAIVEQTDVPFLYLTLDLPPAPVLKDTVERNLIPHVPIFELLQKFDGETVQVVDAKKERRTSILKLPPYLIVHMKRFSKNNFFVEKNSTIVTFPVKNLDFRNYVHPDMVEDNLVTKYNLLANIIHSGQPNAGSYRAQVLNQASSEWFEMEDLRVTPVLPQQVALSESYLHLYQRQDIAPDGSIDERVVQAARMALQQADP